MSHGVAKPNPPEKEDVALIMYTSGTTGTPKGSRQHCFSHFSVSFSSTGVVHTHRSMLAAAAGVGSLVGGSPADGGLPCRLRCILTDSACALSVHLCYLPLAHIFERVAVFTFLQFGAAIGFYGGDMKQLLGDIAALRPTVLLGVPRVFEKIDDGLQQKATGVTGKLLEAAISASERALQAGRRSPPWWTRLITKKTSALLGGASGGCTRAFDSFAQAVCAFC